MKSSQSKKKKIVGAAAALAIVAGISGTFAWQTFQDQKLNRVSNSKVVTDSVTVSENWSQTPITPNGSATKEVAISNQSDMQVFIRASFEEVMRHMKSHGAESESKTPAGAPIFLDYDPDTAADGADIPVFYQGDATDLTTQGYKNVTSKVTGLPTVHAGAKGAIEVWAKGEANSNPTNPLGGVDVTNYGTKIFYHYTIGTKEYYQKMSADFTYEDAAGGPVKDKTTVTDWKFTATSVKAYQYAGGFTYSVKNWAHSDQPSQHDKNTPPLVTGYALLSYEGKNYGTDFDYTVGTIGTLPTTISKYTPVDAPKAADEVKPVFSDQDSAFGGAAGSGTFRVKYGAVTDTSTLDKDHWVYNADDGWFYYLGKVNTSYHYMDNSTTPPTPGPAGTTDKLIKEIQYGAIDERYSEARFDLTVKTEAVQTYAGSNEDILKEEFKLDPSSAGWSTSESKKIYDKLLGL